jgi:fructose-1,6-bisphosphatase/sedoheptulose 1,7-bisphosphatase-like protein
MCLYGSASCLTSIGMNRRVVRRLKAALPRVKRQPVGPVEGTRLVANGLPNAISVIVVASKGSLLPVPTFYMQKLAVGPEARDYIDINAPVRENLRVVAAAMGRKVKDLTVVILDRPRRGLQQCCMRRGP